MGTVLRGGAAGGLSADCVAHGVSHRAQCESHRGARVQKKTSLLSSRFDIPHRKMS
jgi:hypothetical protein